MERLLRTIREEKIALTEYENLADARRQSGRFPDAVYTRKRVHSSLGYLTSGRVRAGVAGGAGCPADRTMARPRLASLQRTL